MCEKHHHREAHPVIRSVPMLVATCTLNELEKRHVPVWHNVNRGVKSARRVPRWLRDHAVSLMRYERCRRDTSEGTTWKFPACGLRLGVSGPFIAQLVLRVYLITILITASESAPGYWSV